MISLRKYAEHRGVSVNAVSKAVKAGRLSKSITRNTQGHPKVTDIGVADTEWMANTDPDQVRVTPTPRAQPAAPTEAEPSGGIPSYADSRARREAARAGLMTLELMKARGRLVSLDGVRAAVRDKVSEIRTKLLGVSTELRSRSSTIEGQDADLVHELIREALEAIADGISTS